MSISLLVKKLIAGIIALLMPITTTVATAPVKNEAPAPAFHAEVREDANAYEFEEEPAPEATPAPTAEVPVANETTAPAPEAEETPVEEKTEVQKIAPVAEWDVSDTDEDDVHMYYYDADAETVLDTITAAVRNIFLPITAYADEIEGVERYDEETTVGKDVYRKGTVVLTGSGKTEEMLFLKWLDQRAFFEAYESWCYEHNYSDSAYILRNYIDENGMFTGDSVPISEIADLYFVFDENDELIGDYDEVYADFLAEIYSKYVPVHIAEFVETYEGSAEDYMDFVPEYVIVGNKVTEINFAAFAFCTEIKEVTFEQNSALTTIDAAAFTRTAIEKITLPESVTTLKTGVFVECPNLREVNVRGIVTNCERDTFNSIADGARIYCDYQTAYVCIANIPADEPMMMSIGQEYTRAYDNRTTVVYYSYL